jgi:peptidoglycan-N-acetylglucosamine deacetylase
LGQFARKFALEYLTHSCELAPVFEVDRSNRVSELVRSISKMPWWQIVMFDLAALMALAFMLALHAAGAAKPAPAEPNARSDKRIALSFDDSPRGPGAFLNMDTRPQMLIAQMRAAGVKQAVFFINPGRIDESNDFAAVMDAYTKAGHVLANHTADHLQLSSVSADTFLADVDEAEGWLKQQRGYRPWFRFPELDEGGRDKAKRDAVRAGLKVRGLRYGYVTADGWDWKLESLAEKAAKSRQPLDVNALRDLYIETHVEAARFADTLGRKAMGRAPAQVLLLHDTDLAALYLGDLIKALRADGWKIITADEAYADPMGKAQPDLADTNGTILQMIAREKKVPGPYWFERNEVKVIRELFNARVLQAK